MEREELIKKVRLYLERAKEDILVENHPIDERGHWRILSRSMGDYGYREPLKNIVLGKFIDAVAYAIQQPEFYVDWDSNDLNFNHGRVEKIKVYELEDEGLAKAIGNIIQL